MEGLAVLDLPQELYLNLKQYCQQKGKALESLVPPTFLLRGPLLDEEEEDLVQAEKERKLLPGQCPVGDVDSIEAFRKYYLSLHEEVSQTPACSESGCSSVGLSRAGNGSFAGGGCEEPVDPQACRVQQPRVRHPAGSRPAGEPRQLR